MEEKTDFIHNEACREKARSQIAALMAESLNTIRESGDTSAFYNNATHFHLFDNAWEVMPPLSQEMWGDKLKNMGANYDPQMQWPGFTTYLYVMDVLMPPNMPASMLYFGYALLDGRLVRATFFVTQTIVDYQAMPQAQVIDPLAVLRGIQPTCYIGCPVEKEDLEAFLIFSQFNKKENPLERFVERTNKQQHEERIERSHMEGYYLQMAYEPQCFSYELIQYAEKKGLYIPRGQKLHTPKIHKQDSFTAPVSREERPVQEEEHVHTGENDEFFLSARHGSYGGDDRLNANGESQMRALATALKKRVGPKATWHIVCSTAPRAKDSAVIFAEAIGCSESDIVYEEYLWAANDAPKGTYQRNPSKEKLTSILQSNKNKASVLVFISHFDIAEELAFVASGIHHSHELSKGQGLLYDAHQQKLIILP